MSERFTVRISDLVFSAAHFITFNNGVGERLHGHNYRVAVEVEGPLDGNHYVFDFIALKKHVTDLLLELDHHMLVALENPHLPVTVNEETVEVRHGAKRWQFPREDCVLLDVGNTTVELLAKHLAERLLKTLKELHRFEPHRIRVDVEENFGQVATCLID